jgi:hypothetical protein
LSLWPYSLNLNFLQNSFTSFSSSWNYRVEISVNLQPGENNIISFWEMGLDDMFMIVTATNVCLLVFLAFLFLPVCAHFTHSLIIHLW